MPVQTNLHLRSIARLLDVPVAAFTEPKPPEAFCSSENGDRWLLLRGEATLFVRHVGNAASGGHVTDESVGLFLARDPGSPQHQAFAALIEAALAAHVNL